MDFDSAITAHTNWKLKLNQFANGTLTDKLDAATVGKDNVCELGKWIHGDAKRLIGSKPEYQDLVRLHAEFHKQAAALITQIEKGQAAQAKAILSDMSSPYCKATTAVVSLLMKLKAQAK